MVLPSCSYTICHMASNELLISIRSLTDKRKRKITLMALWKVFTTFNLCANTLITVRMFDLFIIRDSCISTSDPNQDVVKKMFLYFWILACSDPPQTFFLLQPSGQGKLCNWYCNDSPKSLMHCATAAHCVFHSVNYLQERFSKAITLLSWLNAPRKSWEKSLRINQACLTHTSQNYIVKL